MKIGAMGIRQFDTGYYLYIGSGSENLVQRIKRHLRMEKKKFWHIDYLLSSKQANIRDILVTDVAEEDVVARLEQSDAVGAFDAGFGSTDSAKMSHLFYCRNYGDLGRLKGAMRKWF